MIPIAFFTHLFELPPLFACNFFSLAVLFAKGVHFEQTNIPDNSWRWRAWSGRHPLDPGCKSTPGAHSAAEGEEQGLDGQPL